MLIEDLNNGYKIMSLYTMTTMCEILKSLCAKFVHVYKKRERRRRKQRWRLSNHNESRYHQADSLGSDR